MENKNNYRLKPVSDNNRAALPMEIKMLIMMSENPVRGFDIPDYLFTDAHTRFPEYFEDINENQLYIE